MTTTNIDDLAAWLREARAAAGLSIRRLEERSGVSRSAIMRLEQAVPPQPGVDKLRALAVALQRDQVEIFTAAGYTPDGSLPSFAMYLRSRYGKLPPRARSELEHAFERIASEHGYNLRGPKPHEDE